jgi:hypothetical protein
MGILQQEVPFKRMSAERRTGLQDAVVLILERFLMPASGTVGHPTGHILSDLIASTHGTW